MDENYKIEIGKKLRQARKNKKISLERFSEIIGVNKSTLSRYENGMIDRLDIRKLKEIANALDVSPEWIMGWDVESQKHKNIQRFNNEVKNQNFTDDEMTQIINFCNYIISQRKG